MLKRGVSRAGPAAPRGPHERRRPLPTLVANAVAQDGDALLPMLALDRMAAVSLTLITTVPAVIAGAAAYWIV